MSSPFLGPSWKSVGGYERTPVGNYARFPYLTSETAFIDNISTPATLTFISNTTNTQMPATGYLPVYTVPSSMVSVVTLIAPSNGTYFVSATTRLFLESNTVTPVIGIGGIFTNGNISFGHSESQSFIFLQQQLSLQVGDTVTLRCATIESTTANAYYSSGYLLRIGP